MNGDVVFGNAENFRDQGAAACGLLRGGPDLELAVFEMSAAVSGFERRVRNERIGVRAFDTFAALLNASSTLPSFLSVRCGRLFGQFLWRAGRTVQLLCLARRTFVPFHLELFARRFAPPTRYRQRWRRPVQGRDRLHNGADLDRPSTTKACRTPGMLFISSRFALTTLPPNTGHFW